MPGKAKPRKRKHRGTKTGKIDTRGRTSRPRNRQEAMARAKNQRKRGSDAPQDRRLIAPTWRSATLRGFFFAALLFPVSILFGQPVVGAVILTVIAGIFYVPLGYYTDRFFYKRRRARDLAERQAKKEARRGGG